MIQPDKHNNRKSKINNLSMHTIPGDLTQMHSICELQPQVDVILSQEQEQELSPENLPKRGLARNFH